MSTSSERQQNLVPIENLFDQYRFPDGWKFWAACVYFPFGVLLMFIRLFLGLHAFVVSCILPKSWPLRSGVLRILCSILGIVVTQENVEKRSEQAKVIVSNHVSPTDHTAISLVLPCEIPNVWPIPKLLQLLLGYKNLGADQGRDVLIQTSREYCQSSVYPLLTFPEGAMTNGKKGNTFGSHFHFKKFKSEFKVCSNSVRGLFVWINQFNRLLLP